MPIDADALACLASDYAKGMTSIRGRRVQRLLRREFAGAEQVRLVRDESGTAAVLGFSPGGGAFCCTDGRGGHASVVRWRHGSTEALESRYDLLKDSLPLLGSHAATLEGPRRWARGAESENGTIAF